MTATITVIGIIGTLTIFMALLSLLFLNPLAIIDWSVYVGTTEFGTTDILAGWIFFPYFAMIMTVVGLVIGISTLRGRKWTWKANVIFQLVWIPLIIWRIAGTFVIASNYSFSVLLIQLDILSLLAVASVILALLLRTKTRADYLVMTR